MAVAAVALVGCGSSSSTTTTKAATESVTASTSGAHVVTVLEGMLKFDTTTLSAKAGTVIITMKNPPAPTHRQHGIAVEGNGVDKVGKIVPPAGTSVLAVQLKAGKYTFYCPVPGHRQAGMQGTLTVT